MIKKLISAATAAAIAMTVFASFAFAEKTYDLRLDSGATAYNASNDRQYFSVWCDDLAGEFTSSIQIQVKVIKGSLDAASCKVSKGSSSKGGVYIPADPDDEEAENEYLSANAWTFNVMDEADGTQSVRISWGSSTPVTTDNGKLLELYVVPSTEGDIELELGSKDLTNVINTCTANNSNKVDHMFTPTTPLQYVLTDATSTITEKKADPSPSPSTSPDPTDPPATPDPTEDPATPTPEVNYIAPDNAVVNTGAVWTAETYTDIDTDANNYEIVFAANDGAKATFALDFGNIVTSGSATFDIVLRTAKTIVGYVINAIAK